MKYARLAGPLAGVLAWLMAGLPAVTLLVPEGGNLCGPVVDNSGYCDFEHRLSERQWLRKHLRESEVRMRLGEPERIDAYGLLSFWRYPGARTIIFDSSGQVIGWENF